MKQNVEIRFRFKPIETADDFKEIHLKNNQTI